MARAAAAPPSNAATKRHHPPYKEMILSAVAALKEKKGSSRAAIAKFIAASYSDLPATHDALLSTHLRRLRNQGRLLMLKHSYKLPSPPPPPPPPSASAPTRRPGRPPGSALVIVEVPAEKRRPGRPRKAGLGAAPPAEKRRPGRPPKLLSSLSNPAALMAVPLSTWADAAVLSERRKPGRPRKQPLALDLVGKRKRGRPVKTLSLGLSDDATVLAQRRKRGRPPKQQFSGARALAPHSVGKRKPGRPPKVLLLGSSAHDAVVAKPRKPGRPPKYPPVAPALALVSTGRRKPGRPRKVLMVSSSPGGTSGNVLAMRRKPGRPPKYPLVAPAVPPDSNFVTNGAVEGLIYLSGISMANSNSDAVPAPNLTVTTEKRKPGRPKKDPLLAPPIKGAAASVGPTGKKRGRPPKSQAPAASVAVEGMADSGEKMEAPRAIPHAEV